jgi:hypothetical protein
MYASLQSKKNTSHLTSGTLFNWTGTIEIVSIIGRITTDTEAASNTCKLSVTPDAQTPVDICTTKDLNHLHAGTMLYITGTLGDAMIGTDVVAVAISQATKIRATCITSGTITVTYGTAAKDGAITWEIDWRPLSQGATLQAA